MAAAELRIARFKIEAARLIAMQDLDAAAAARARKREWDDFVKRFNAEMAVISAMPVATGALEA